MLRLLAKAFIRCKTIVFILSDSVLVNVLSPIVNLIVFWKVRIEHYIHYSHITYIFAFFSLYPDSTVQLGQLRSLQL